MPPEKNKQWSLPFAGSQSVQLLSGPSGHVETINQGVSEFTWESPDRTVHDLEVRAQLRDSNAVIGTTPIVRWRMSIGHGTNEQKEPAESFRIISGTPIPEYTLPLRGMVARVSARNLRMYFRMAGLTSGVPPAIFTGTLAVSVQPVKDSKVPDFPYQHAVLTLVRNPIPQYAREWMFYDFNGLPFAPAACAIAPMGPAGALLPAIDAADLADWRPVPHDATTFGATDPCYVSFR